MPAGRCCHGGRAKVSWLRGRHPDCFETGGWGPKLNLLRRQALAGPVRGGTWMSGLSGPTTGFINTLRLGRRHHFTLPPRRLGDLCIHPLTCTYPGCPQPQPMAAPSKTHRFHPLGWAVRPMGTHWRSRLRIGHGKGVREQGTEPGTLACISHHLTAGRAAQGWSARFNGLPSPSWACPGCSTCVAVPPLVAFVA